MFGRAKRAARKARRRHDDQVPARENLPVGAEAALWSIVEVLPDPRNHLALTRDPTVEVRLSPAAIAEAMAAAPTAATTAAPAPAPAPVPAPVPVPVPVIAIVEPTPAPAPLPRRKGITWSPDTAEVRLPSFSAPQDAAEPQPYARGA